MLYASTKIMDNEWRRWIGENLVLGNPAENVVKDLVKLGFSFTIAQKEVALAQESPYLGSHNRLKNRLEKRDWVLDIYRKLNRLQFNTIERIDKISRKDFFENYYLRNRPVLITGMMEDWPAMQKWNFAYLKENFGDKEVEIQFGRNSDVNYESNSAKYRKKMPFGEYLALIETSEATNDFYMTANNDSLNKQALKDLWKDIVVFPEYLTQTEEEQGFLWVGPKGTITPFHHDLTNNFMAQVVGSKKLKLIPTCDLPNVYNDNHCFTSVNALEIDFERYPKMKNAQILECELMQGELLFLPIGYWHYVEGLETSITITFTNFLLDNDFYTMYPKVKDY